MKHLLVCIVCLFALSISISSCGAKDTKQKTEKVALDGKEYTSKYVCPMHCAGSGSEVMGTCPVCKMDLELNEDFVQEGSLEVEDANDTNDHEGHDHDSHEGHDH